MTTNFDEISFLKYVEFVGWLYLSPMKAICRFVK